MCTKASTSLEILALFSSFREKRIRLYKSFIEEIDDFEDWTISAERLLAYYILIRNLKDNCKMQKELIQKELIKLSEGDFILQ